MHGFYITSIVIVFSIIFAKSSLNYSNRDGKNEDKILEQGFVDYLKHTKKEELGFRSEPNNGGGNETLIYTHISPVVNLNDYERSLNNSYVFKYESKYDFSASINLFSTTENFHPNVIISKKKGDSHYTLVSVNANKSIRFSSGNTYVIEIGTDDELETIPFKNLASGGFICVISSEIGTFTEIMSSELIKIGVNGHFGHVAYADGDVLEMQDYTKFSLSFGVLNFKITPYYSTSKGSITMYYHKGSDELTHGKKRSTIIEFECNENAKRKTFYGVNHKSAEHSFKVQSKNVCKMLHYLN